jgi:Nif-specific regulatory protein
MSEQLYDKGVNLFEIAEAMFENKGYFDEAASMLGEAETIFERLGANHQLEKVKKLREKHMTDKLDKGSEQYLAKLKQVSTLIKDIRAEHLSDEDGKLGLPYQYLEGLREVSELINRRLGKENFTEDLLEIVLKLSNAQRGVVFCHEDGELHPVVSEKMDDATSLDALRISRTVINNLRQGLAPVYTSDATTDERFRGSQSILLNKIRSIMCIPLKTDDALLGTIYVDSKQTGLFDIPRITFFAAIGNLLAVSIEKSMEFKKLREDLILTRQKLSFEESGIVVGSSSAMKKLCSQLEKVASTDTNILLEGETGTGKGVFARMIHERSNRSQRELCVINCGVLPENTFESELFGTKKGAYTGATADRIGLLEAANCSTVFFDEITNTLPQMQAKLLEVIEDKVIRRMGETRHRQVNLRFVFATNRDLAEEVKAGRFREDLYYRISALTLKLPPLRKRKKDLTEFISFFLKKFSREFNKEISGVDEHGMKMLLGYPWPGNIRELRNVIERSVLLTPGSRITKDIIEQYLIPVADSAEGVERGVLDVKDLNLEQAKKKFEERLIRQALASNKTVEEAAEALGISRTTLWRKMSAFNIKPKE